MVAVTSGLRENFRWLSVCFAVVHGFVMGPFVYSSTLLGLNCGVVGNGILYLASVLCVLKLSVFVTDSLGLKRALLIGVLGWIGYLIFFTLATFAAPSQTAIRCALYWVGSCIGGIGAGVLWTAQGGFFGRSAALVAEEECRSSDEVTSQMAGQFALVFLIVEVLAKVGFSILQSLGVPVWAIMIIYIFVCAIAFVALCFLEPMPYTEDGDPQHKRSRCTTFQLWTDPNLWLLTSTNITFGFSAAYINGYFNATQAVPALGKQSPGWLSGVTVISAAVFVKAWGWLSARFGKGTAIAVGALSMSVLPIVMLRADLRSSGWWILIFFITQGSGRAVYESTNKSLFADFFKKEKTEAAFANCFVQASAVSALCSFITALHGGEWFVIWATLVSAVLTLPMYGLAISRKAKEDGPDSESASLLPTR